MFSFTITTRVHLMTQYIVNIITINRDEEGSALMHMQCAQLFVLASQKSSYCYIE